MSKPRKRDLLIHFDEEKNDFVFFSIPESKTEEIRSSEFDGARISVNEYTKMMPDDAERDLGGTVFSLIDTFSKKAIAIRDYAAIHKEKRMQEVMALEEKAASGNVEAQYLLGLEYQDRALFSSDARTLEKAEQMLNSAAAAGHREALSHLKVNWPNVRAAAERKICRRLAADQQQIDQGTPAPTLNSVNSDKEG